MVFLALPPVENSFASFLLQQTLVFKYHLNSPVFYGYYSFCNCHTNAPVFYDFIAEKSQQYLKQPFTADIKSKRQKN